MTNPSRNGVCEYCPAQPLAGSEVVVWTMHVVNVPGKPPHVVTTPRRAVPAADADQLDNQLAIDSDTARKEILQYLESQADVSAPA
jgi:hypothetical protein